VIRSTINPAVAGTLPNTCLRHLLTATPLASPLTLLQFTNDIVRFCLIQSDDAQLAPFNPFCA